MHHWFAKYIGINIGVVLLYGVMQKCIFAPPKKVVNQDILKKYRLAQKARISHQAKFCYAYN